MSTPRGSGRSCARTVEAGEESFELRIAQSYQELRLRAERAGRTAPALGASLRGSEIRFSAFDRDGAVRHYRGRVAGELMSGESSGEDVRALAWRARRVGP